jgi:hypothetical protein
MSSRDFIRPIDHVDVGKYNHVKTRDRGIRLYCTASAETHGGDNARYALQVFAPMKLANGQEGRDYVIATASLSPQDLVALRAEVDAAIAEVEEVYPHATSPRYANHTAGSPAGRASHTKKRGAQ